MLQVPVACSGALGGSFFPGTVPLWGGLPSSVVSSGTTGGGLGDSFGLLVRGVCFGVPLVCFLWVVLVAHPECFSLLLNSKFSHPPHLG